MATEHSPTAEPDPGKPQSKWLVKLGIGLILLSGVFFFSMLAIPLTPLSVTNKAILAAVLFVCVQVSWWVGAPLAGAGFVKKMFSWFRPQKTNDIP